MSPGIQSVGTGAIPVLASQGVRAMSEQEDYSSGRSVGDGFLGSITSQAGASDLESLVARTARQAADQRLDVESAYHGQELALQVLAAGVGGPAGAVLGSLGARTLGASADYEDGRHMAGAFLEAIQASSADEREIALAEAADRAGDRRLADESAYKVYEKALGTIGNGVTGTLPVVLAEFGEAALDAAEDYEDARAVGTPILEVIQNRSQDANVKALAAAAAAAVDGRLANESAYNVEKRAFQLIPDTHNKSTGQVLASLGVHVSNDASDSEDARSMGFTVLKAIASGAQDPIEKLVAETALRATDQRLADASVDRMQHAAFDAILNPSSEPPDKALAALGTASHQAAEDDEDAHAMGTVILEALEQVTSDARVKSLAQFTLQACNGADDSSAAQSLRDAFQSITAGTFSGVTVLPSAGTPLPAGVPSEVESDPEKLKQAIAQNEEAARAMADVVGARSADLAQVKASMQEIAKELEPLASADQATAHRGQLAQKVLIGSGATMVGGLVLLQLVLPPVAIGMAAVGGVGLAASMIARERADFKRAELRMGAAPLNRRYELLEVQSSQLEREIAAAQATQDQAEANIRAAEGQLGVHKMAQAVTTAPEPNATVEMGHQEVRIGNLVIPRNTGGAPTT